MPANVSPAMLSLLKALSQRGQSEANRIIALSRHGADRDYWFEQGKSTVAEFKLPFPETETTYEAMCLANEWADVVVGKTDQIVGALQTNLNAFREGLRSGIYARLIRDQIERDADARH